MTAAADWVTRALKDAPEPVLDAMLKRSGRDLQLSTPAALTRAAVAEYAAVLNGPGGREDAFPLLIADALLTHAFQAEADGQAGPRSEVERIWNEGLRDLIAQIDR